MVDTDQEMVLQALQSGALDAVTFENDGSFVVAVDALGPDHGVGEWQLLIDARNTVVQDHVGMLAHQAQNLGSRPGPTPQHRHRGGRAKSAESGCAVRYV